MTCPPTDDRPGDVRGDGEESRRAALEALESSPAEQPVIVDFDETLVQRNSTSEYLRSVRPYALGRLVCLLLDLLRPWAWLPGRLSGPDTRDWFHVVAVTVLFPWTLLVWRRRAARLAAGWANERLIHVLRARAGRRVIVSTQGFGFIVRVILGRMGLPPHSLDACRFWSGFLDRGAGKLARLVRLFGEDTISRAIVVTDSEEDRAVLDRAALPLLVRWPAPVGGPPLPAYVPFLFMRKVKHGGWGHFRSMIVGEDLILLWLGLSLASPQPVLHAIATVFLLLSFWVVYEMGYMENDVVAERHEREPVLKAAFFSHKDLIAFREPWLWAIAFALPGLGLLRLTDGLEGSLWGALTDGGLRTAAVASWDAGALLAGLGVWMLLLVGLRALYFVYNYADKMSRVWMYPLLQGLRSFGFAVLSPLSLPGAVAFFGTVASRWVLYAIYRAARVEWPGTELGQVYRLALVVGLGGMLMFYDGPREALLTVQGGVLLAWCVWRARRPLVRLIREAHHIRGDSWRSPGR